jgi:exonuclease SbcC
VARLAEVTDQARETAAAHGFTEADDLREALLPSGERERLGSWLQERDRVAHQARAVIDDPGDADLDAQPSDDIAELSALVSRTEASATASAREVHLCEERAAAVTAARERLCAALEEWSPVRDESLRAESMARLVRGTGHDNQLQMRLSAYVLATRLDSVLAAANERLGHLRDQRYLLQRAARAARRGTQAGLGLEVVDQWTGDVRDPATLSGGETFVVSLSLALGLADVVTQEAGGTEIETLFVDEGFGTLDADTLDDVMDRLDGLRAGGRTVGVVSHVNELRNRIPTQVHVHKGRSGSSVAVRTLVG